MLGVRLFGAWGRARPWLALTGALLVWMSVGESARSAGGSAEQTSLRGPFVPPSGKTLLIIGHDIDSIEGYIKGTDEVPAGFMVYTSIQRLEGLRSSANNGAGTNHAQRLVERYPHSALQMGLWAVGALDGINAGTFDENIDKLAEWARDTERPVFIRFGYEFDLPANGYTPEAYKAAWRRMAERFKAKRAFNVAWVWHSFSGDADVDLLSWYPGDDLVDWCAVTWFDQDPSYMEPMARFARLHGKPLMIAEATPRGYGVETAKIWKFWLGQVRAFIEKYDVRAFSYIAVDWPSQPMFGSGGWPDARIQKNPEVAAYWRSLVLESPRYLQASDTLFSELKPTGSELP